jgi:DNA-directed RNA polymerase subunit D
MDMESVGLNKIVNGKMSVRILEERGKKMRFVVEGESVDSSLVNGLRRAMMGEVETMAIDQLKIHQNTTMVHDELLFHKLGLIPLLSEHANEFVHRYECDCDDGCPKCMAKFTLNVRNNSDEVVMIGSKDLICHDPRVKPINADIALIKLAKNQEIHFTAYAIRSSARYENNAKWNPVEIATFRPLSHVTVNVDKINQYLTPSQQRQLCASEPGQVLVYDELNQCVKAHPNADTRCTFSGEFIETLAEILHPPKPKVSRSKDEKENVTQTQTQTNEKEEKLVAELVERDRVLRHPNELVHPFISMIPQKNRFLFAVVSNGCLSPRQIVQRAIIAIRKRLIAIQILNKRLAVTTSHSIS